MKKGDILLLITLLVVVLAIPLNAFAADTGIKLSIDGKLIEFNSSVGYPFVDTNGRTQVPFRITLEKFGAKVSWNQATSTAIAEKDGIRVEVPVGQKYIFNNGKKIESDTVALIKDSKTYLPIRLVVEALGGVVEWDNTSKTVNIKNVEKVQSFVTDGVYLVGSKEFCDKQSTKYTNIKQRTDIQWLAEGALDQNNLVVISVTDVFYDNLPTRIKSVIARDKYSSLTLGGDVEYQVKVDKATIAFVKAGGTKLEAINNNGLAFKGYFKNPDYSDPSIFLKTDMQTKATSKIMEAASKVNNLKDISTLREIFSIVHGVPYIQTGAKQTATADEVLRNGSNGCTNYAILFAAVAREKGIPTVIVNTAYVNWIRDIQSNPTHRMIEGHFFVEVLLADGKWYLVDSTSGRLFLNYDKENFSIYSGGRDYYVYAKSLEVIDSGITSDSQIGLIQKQCFIDFDTNMYNNPQYQEMRLD